MKMKIYIQSPGDRDTVISVLARNGYTVRQGREKQGNRAVSFVEYWKSDCHDS